MAMRNNADTQPYHSSATQPCIDHVQYSRAACVQKFHAQNRVQKFSAQNLIDNPHNPTRPEKEPMFSIADSLEVLNPFRQALNVTIYHQLFSQFVCNILIWQIYKFIVKGMQKILNFHSSVQYGPRAQPYKHNALIQVKYHDLYSQY